MMRYWSRAYLLFAISVLALRCSETPTSRTGTLNRAPDATVTNLDGSIEIGCHQTVLIEEEHLFITFSEVTEGRCHTGAQCFWPGQASAELLLSKADETWSVAKPFIQPGVGPERDLYFELADEAIGYRLFLEALDPYPNIERPPIDPREYIARLRIVPLPADHWNKIIFTWTPPGELQRDPFLLRNATITGDRLELSVSYSGGCGRHLFRLFMQPAFMESYPVQANLYLQHATPGDPCDAIIARVLPVDIRSIAELHRDMYGGYDEIILNVYGYFEGAPSGSITVSYTPE
jgi:hypothetical protein